MLAFLQETEYPEAENMVPITPTGTKRENFIENCLRCFINVSFMIKPLQFKRWWRGTELMVVPHFTATDLLNMIQSRFLWIVPQKRRFFFFLKFHLIKGQWSAGVQTSNCLASNPDGLWRVSLALLPCEAFELGSYVMACVCGDLMPVKLKWGALNMSLQTRHLSRPRVSFLQHHFRSSSNATRPGNVFTHMWSKSVRVDTCFPSSDCVGVAELTGL